MRQAIRDLLHVLWQNIRARLAERRARRYEYMSAHWVEQQKRDAHYHHKGGGDLQ